MYRNYIFYNPYAGNHKGRENAEILAVVYDNPVCYDMTWMTSYEDVWEQMDESDQIILCGGDGTLNFFANWIRGKSIPAPVYFYSIGHGDDFVRDIGKRRGDSPYFCIDDYIKDLPEVTIKDESMLFVNGLYFGPASGNWKEISHHVSTDVVVRVDGEVYSFENVQMISVTKGRYCNSGMLVAPEQDRLESLLTIKIIYGFGKVRMYHVLSAMMKEKRLRNQKKIVTIAGREISMVFSHPVSLNVDGKDICDIQEFSI